MVDLRDCAHIKDDFREAWKYFIIPIYLLQTVLFTSSLVWEKTHDMFFL